MVPTKRSGPCQKAFRVSAGGNAGRWNSLNRIQTSILCVKNDAIGKERHSIKIETGNLCRLRHLKCDEQQPCERCWKEGASCIYAENPVFTAKEWDPEEIGLPPRPSPSAVGQIENDPKAGFQFVHENKNVESHYQLLGSEDPASAAQRIRADLRGPDPPASQMRFRSSFSTDQVAHRMMSPEVVTPVTDPTHAFFFDRYCKFIGPWFDLFDSQRHWSHVVPHLSLYNRSLYLSILASTSKQHYLISLQRMDTALAYYNDALQELTLALESVSETDAAAIFASCLLIGYCEMLDAKNQDWHTHLSGAFSLRSAQGWHGCSGGLAQSCFWVYCRMDILASLATVEPSRLDVSIWLPDGASLAPREPSAEWHPDSWSNNVVLLLARAHNLLCDVRRSPCPPGEYLLHDWQSLQTSIMLHERARPREFQPLIVLPANPDDVDNPFETIRYISARACAATQMLDLANLLLILSYPDSTHLARAARLGSHITTSRANSLAQKIVANSVINRETIAWVNAVQLIHSAGMVLVGTKYRNALIRVLADFRSETGWNTQEDMDALENWWGWHDRRSLEDGGLHEVGECLLRVFELGIVR